MYTLISFSLKPCLCKISVNNSIRLKLFFDFELNINASTWCHMKNLTLSVKVNSFIYLSLILFHFLQKKRTFKGQNIFISLFPSWIQLSFKMNKFNFFTVYFIMYSVTELKLIHWKKKIKHKYDASCVRICMFKFLKIGSISYILKNTKTFLSRLM